MLLFLKNRMLKNKKKELGLYNKCPGKNYMFIYDILF